ncbi:MAG: thiamine-phosphate kinase [Gammaproteobacteria bacterium]|nr:thiamine-phosphate kinase [Gammaproteobacteria bacterium]
MSEFNLINHYFRSLSHDVSMKRDDVILGIGDDCAILQVPEGKQLVVSTDTLVSGVHFPENTSAYDIGYKSLAVNLSDLAAMGAEPAWVTLCLTLPEENSDWLAEFVKGFSELLKKNNVQLVGGDTTRGPLSISVHVSGFVDKDKSFRRDAAKSGDLIYVTGSIGDAGLGLKKLLGEIESDSLSMCVDKLNHPVPRNEVAAELSAICFCAIDVSDGLLADLSHITEASQCGADIFLDKIPLSDELISFYGDTVDMNQVLTSGDDYELCFTLNEKHKNKIDDICKRLNIAISCIGKITAGDQVRCLDINNEAVEIKKSGFQHF